MTDDFIRIEKGLGPYGRIAVVHFDRGIKANPLSTEAMRQLRRAAESFEDDMETSVVILTGTATAFVGSGAGLTNLPSSAGLVLKDGNGVTLGKVVSADKTGATVLTSTGYLIEITFDGILYPAQIYYAGTNGSGNAILNDGQGGTLASPRISWVSISSIPAQEPRSRSRPR